MRRAPATAKLNLALVVGPAREDGKHEVLTVLQRLDFCDRIALEPSPRLQVEGFSGDTLVEAALRALADEADASPAWRVRIVKRIPVASGLGGGSSDAATALRLANAMLERPLDPARLRWVAARIGADVPFFLSDGPQLGHGDGSELIALDLPQDYWVVLVVPQGIRKTSTADVYARFDARRGAEGFHERRGAFESALSAVRRSRDLARLPPNDLASSPHAETLRKLGAFRADVTGAGPVVYGLFHHGRAARAARAALRRVGTTYLAVPCWYG